jgi:hypothetical protein
MWFQIKQNIGLRLSDYFVFSEDLHITASHPGCPIEINFNPKIKL